MKHGHVTGAKRERRPRQRTLDRYREMGEAIAAKLASAQQKQEEKKHD